MTATMTLLWHSILLSLHCSNTDHDFRIASASLRPGPAMPDDLRSKSGRRETLTKYTLPKLARPTSPDQHGAPSQPLADSARPANAQHSKTTTPAHLPSLSRHSRNPTSAEPSYPHLRTGTRDRMNIPQRLPDELQQLIQPEESRPKGRRHRRAEKEVYHDYPAIVNQSFAFQQPQPAVTPSSANPMARRARVPATRPESVVSLAATRGSGSRATSVTSRPPVDMVELVVPSATPIVSMATTVTESPPVLPPLPFANPAQQIAPTPVVMVYPVKEDAQIVPTKTVTFHAPHSPSKPVSHAIVDEYEDDISCPICMNVM